MMSRSGRSLKLDHLKDQLFQLKRRLFCVCLEWNFPAMMPVLLIKNMESVFVEVLVVKVEK